MRAAERPARATRAGGHRPRGRVAQFAAPDAVEPRRQSRARRLLHLHVHQLAAHASLSSAPGRRSTGRDSSSSACTHPSSRSSGTSTTSVARCSRCEIDYPIVIDNDYAIWRAFNNQYWPALYFVDARDASASITSARASTSGPRRPFSNCSPKPEPAASATASCRSEASGVEIAADWANLKSPENYLGLRADAELRVAWRGRAAIGAASMRRPRAWRSISGRWQASGRWADRQPS